MGVFCCGEPRNLNDLLFCNHCRSVRCPLCVVTEPVAWFCQQCLLETTKHGAREAGNRCMRNCLLCPSCPGVMVAKQGGAECPSCKFFFKNVSDEPLARQVRALRSIDFKKVQETVIKRFSRAKHGVDGQLIDPVEPVSPRVSQSSLVPRLMPLRAKWVKRCRSCSETLADPDRRPVSAGFVSKSLARTHFPEISVYIVKDQYKLVARNPVAMNVRCDHPGVPPILEILGPGATGFLAPLVLVERESLASRQAFMASNSNSGPGWVVVDIEPIDVLDMKITVDEKTCRVLTPPIKL